jgi:hypothetical protein
LPCFPLAAALGLLPCSLEFFTSNETSKQRRLKSSNINNK